MKNLYSKYYSEKSLWEKIKKFFKAAGVKVVYAVLLLFYVMQDKKVSIKTKLSIAAALGYFIFPFDAIIDLTPLIGYSDDLGVLLFTISQVSSKITPETEQKAKDKLNVWFDEVDEKELQGLIKKTE